MVGGPWEESPVPPPARNRRPEEGPGTLCRGMPDPTACGAGEGNRTRATSVESRENGPGDRCNPAIPCDLVAHFWRVIVRPSRRCAALRATCVMHDGRPWAPLT